MHDKGGPSRPPTCLTLTGSHDSSIRSRTVMTIGHDQGHNNTATGTAIRPRVSRLASCQWVSPTIVCIGIGPSCLDSEVAFPGRSPRPVTRSYL
ncbi:hypothetical protein C8Q79DRAFT_963595 [Trametes meyenii]|nr:hypothetical protein C8Q79DRAFT_963595 [Trametes meyenii]